MSQQAMSLPPKISADTVMRLLATKHSKDLFIPECKAGPTMTSNARALRMDAWVMPKSWAHPHCTGYEVKVSKGDFRNDEKWHDYLPLCNKLYFVAPASVCSRDEVPEQCGLLEVSKNGRRLLTRKHAPIRDVQIPESLWRYVLMWRTEVISEYHQKPKAEHWREWLETRAEDTRVGHMIAGIIHGKVLALVDDVRNRNRELENRIKDVNAMENAMAAAGIKDLGRWDRNSAAERALARNGCEQLVMQIESLRQNLDNTLRTIKEQSVDSPEDEG